MNPPVIGRPGRPGRKSTHRRFLKCQIVSPSRRTGAGAGAPTAGIRKYDFGIGAAIFRQRSLWRLAVLALAPLLVSCGSPSPSSASTKDTNTTKTDGVPQPLHVTRVSPGPKPGMHIVGSPNFVWVSGQSGRVTFGLFLTNKGTASYHCAALEATQIPANGVAVRPYAPLGSSAGPGQTIAPGSQEFLVFFLPGNRHPPKDIVVLPYGSNAGRMIWTVASCPTLPKSCLGRFQKLGS